MINILRHTMVIVSLLLLLLTAATAAADERQLYYEVEMTSAPLDQAAITAVLNQQISVHQAARMLMMAINYTNIPGAFNRYLHKLHYQLGQLSHNEQAPWTPRAKSVCLAMFRSIALFTQLQNQPFNTPVPLNLLALSTPEVLPENDCLAIAGVTATPHWHTRSGKTFHAAVLALPHRLLTAVQPVWSPLLDSDGQAVQTAPLLESLHYYLAGKNWQHTLQKAAVQPLGCSIQIYRLSIALPDSLPPGSYHGQLIFQVPGLNGQAVLKYKLTIIP